MKSTRIHKALAMLLCTTCAGLAQQAGARDCSYDGVAGRYGYTSNGLIVAGAIPFTAVGQVIFRKAGTFSASQLTSVGGTLVEETVEATYTVNADCTGSAVASVYHGSTLARTTNLHLVWDNNQLEARGLYLTPGTAISIQARRMFGD